jgi:hypothetical protein
MGFERAREETPSQRAPCQLSEPSRDDWPIIGRAAPPSSEISMRSEEKPSIRLINVLGTPLRPGSIPSPHIPKEFANSTEGGLAVFELRGYLGVTNYITIPVALQMQEHIADAHASLHEMLEFLSEQTSLWKRGGGTP